MNTQIEQEFLRTIRDALADAVKAKVTQGYHDSPLNKMIDEVVRDHMGELRGLVDQSFVSALRDDGFKYALKDTFNHKLSRVLMSKFEGEIEKRTNELRADPIMRSRIMLAIEKAISDIKS